MHSTANLIQGQDKWTKSWKAGTVDEQSGEAFVCGCAFHR